MLSCHFFLAEKASPEERARLWTEHRHADPRTTMRYDRARKNLERHANYILAAYMASGTRRIFRSCGCAGRVTVLKITCVESFVFRIGDAFDTPQDFDGETTLAGGRIGNGNLAIGDAVLVPVRAGGTVRAVCAGFPLMSFSDHEWLALSITGLTVAEVLVGGLAERA